MSDYNNMQTDPVIDGVAVLLLPEHIASQDGAVHHGIVKVHFNALGTLV